MKQPNISLRNRQGASLIEFTLVGIPLIFVLISTFEISRGMWIYHTLAYSVKEGVRFAEVHGINCINTADNPNNCPTTIAEVTQVIRNAGIGVDPYSTTLTFTPGATGSAATSCKMAGTTAADCPQKKTTWPPYDPAGSFDLNSVGKPIRIDISTPFPNAIAMFWPGSGGTVFGAYTFGASCTDYIQF